MRPHHRCSTTTTVKRATQNAHRHQRRKLHQQSRSSFPKHLWRVSACVNIIFTTTHSKFIQNIAHIIQIQPPPYLAAKQTCDAPPAQLNRKNWKVMLIEFLRVRLPPNIVWGRSSDVARALGASKILQQYKRKHLRNFFFK